MQERELEMKLNSILESYLLLKYILPGIWGFILFPFSIVFLYEKKTKPLGIIFIIASIFFFSILVRDFVAYKYHIRPIIPLYEWICCNFFPYHDPRYILVDIPVKDYTTNILHYWRGKYGVTIRIQNKLQNLSEEDFYNLYHHIQFAIIFLDGDEQLLNIRTDIKNSKPSHWGLDGGNIIYYEYNIPDDLPCDRAIAFKISIIKKYEDFHTKFPDARLQVKKLWK